MRGKARFTVAESRHSLQLDPHRATGAPNSRRRSVAALSPALANFWSWRRPKPTRDRAWSLRRLQVATANNRMEAIPTAPKLGASGLRRCRIKSQRVLASRSPNDSSVAQPAPFLTPRSPHLSPLGYQEAAFNGHHAFPSDHLPPERHSLANSPPRQLAMADASVARRLAVQGVFLATGVFSTCAAQFAFYAGAGDQRAMLLPLCNYLGMMLSGLVPAGASASAASVDKPQRAPLPPAEDEPERTGAESAEQLDWTPPDHVTVTTTELTRRQTAADADSLLVEGEEAELLDKPAATAAPAASWALTDAVTAAWRSQSTVQICVLISVVLDFAGCIFSNVGLSMAGSGLFQVVYSSVICWSALMSRIVLKKIVTKEQWVGIALVTFGLAFSALGESSGGRNNAIVLMGCFNTLVGAAFYGGNYVAGEYTLKLPERPQPRELCLKIGTACVAIIAVYQCFFVLPRWHELVTNPIADAGGNTLGIFIALLAYTLSQLAHGITYFMLLGSSGAVTTGIMQSLRAVCVFVISSLLYCSQQESQCFDTKRGVATLIVVSGVMFYSWAKAQGAKPPQVAAALGVALKAKDKVVAGKSYIV